MGKVNLRSDQPLEFLLEEKVIKEIQFLTIDLNFGFIFDGIVCCIRVQISRTHKGLDQ